MTAQEIIEKSAEAHTAAQRAMTLHGLAMTAFGVACARFEWKIAAKEHQLAIEYLDAYLNAMMTCHRLAQEMGK